jgi:hypothetical protein
MDSKSLVTASLEKFPSMKYQYTPGRALRGGFLNPASSDDTSLLEQPHAMPHAMQAAAANPAKVLVFFIIALKNV